MFAVSYFSTVFTWTLAEDLGDGLPEVLLVPVVGPFLSMGDADTRAGRIGLAWDGLIQGAGLVLFATGLVPRYYVRSYASGEGPGIALAPWGGPMDAGLDLRVTF
jgi:hypothetical protein